MNTLISKTSMVLVLATASSMALAEDIYSVVLDGIVEYQATQSSIIPPFSGDWVPPLVSDPATEGTFAIIAPAATPWDGLDGLGLATGGPGMPVQLEIKVNTSGEIVDFTQRFPVREVLGYFPTAVVVREAGYSMKMDTENIGNGNITCTTTIDAPSAGKITYECPLDPAAEDEGYVEIGSVTGQLLAPIQGGSIDPFSPTPQLAWKPNGVGTFDPLISGVDAVTPVLFNDGVTPATFDPGTGPLTVFTPTAAPFNQTAGNDIMFGTEGEATKFIMDYSGVIGHPGFQITNVERWNVNQLQVETSPTTSVPFVTVTRFSHDSVVSEVQFGSASKNVPAMGLVGLGALFSGLMLLGIRMRRAVH